MNAERHFETGVEFYYEESIGNDSDNFLDRIASANILPFRNSTILFNDDIWDFTSLNTLNTSKKDLKYNFKRVDAIYRNDLKKYVIFKILENKMKLTSIKRNFDEISHFFNHLHISNVFSIEDIDYITIKSHLENKMKKSFLSNRAAKHALRGFFNYYASTYRDIVTIEIDSLLQHGDFKEYKAVKNQNKIPDIPKDYFSLFLKGIIKIITDSNEDDYIRAIGCVLLIMSQTGLRVSEILALEIGSLESITIIDKQEVNYLKYKTWKREKGQNFFTYEKTFVNDLTKFAYLTLLNIHSKRRDDLKVKYLYMGGKDQNNVENYPIDANEFLKLQKIFYISLNKYVQTVDVGQHEEHYNSLNTSKIHSSVIKHLKMNKLNGETLTFPTTQQFRVHVCTDLYHKGVPLQYVQKFMGHLSNEMQGYYVRPKNQMQENIDYSKKTLESILTGSITLLGSNSNDLISKIQDFVKDNNFNVQKDLNTIIDSLLNKIPIRQKMGGVCIKSSMLRECSVDAKTNEFYCAYGVCPNVFHFFYNIDISYRKARELSQSIAINNANGFVKQVQKEKNMLKTVLQKQFLPELDELKNTLKRRSVEEIFIEYPDIKDIVENLSQIEMEAASWMKLATE